MNHSQSLAAMVGLMLIAACALFPPRCYPSGSVYVTATAPRGFLFDPGIYFVQDPPPASAVVIDLSHLIAECIAVGALTGLSLVALRTQPGQGAA